MNAVLVAQASRLRTVSEWQARRLTYIEWIHAGCLRLHVMSFRWFRSAVSSSWFRPWSSAMWLPCRAWLVFHGLVKVSFMAWGQIKEHLTPGGAGLHMLVSVVFTFMVFGLWKFYLKSY